VKRGRREKGPDDSNVRRESGTRRTVERVLHHSTKKDVQRETLKTLQHLCAPPRATMHALHPPHSPHAPPTHNEDGSERT